jgi:dTDP-4-dehydrorhamnose 3,5-epimerase
MEFIKGSIKDVVVCDLGIRRDYRGWLVELFREDAQEMWVEPVMAYVSATAPGVVRGPHEHSAQTDYFCFFGPGNFEVTLWDNRSGSPTYKHTTTFLAGQDRPTAVLVPPGVVHAYKNIGDYDGWVFNAPDKLYAGWMRSEPVDEIRHELDLDSPFVVD